MTRDEIITFGKKKHGERWIGKLAKEVGYSFTQLWRVAEGESPVTRRLELEMLRVMKRDRMKHLAVSAKRYD